MTQWEGPDEIAVVGFSWDEHKNATNRDKHSVDFDEAATCFEQRRDKRFIPSALKGEMRWVFHGDSDLGRPLSTIFTLVVRGASLIMKWSPGRGPLSP
ncbi:MAG: BrnT family toxin [Armatimonadetes bacterium]|nr:BrnT family toxin [Armatimonadota bacterium]